MKATPLLVTLIKGEQVVAKNYEEERRLWKIRRLKNRAARDPNKNTEIFLDKPIIVED